MYGKEGRGIYTSYGIIPTLTLIIRLSNSTTQKLIPNPGTSKHS